LDEMTAFIADHTGLLRSQSDFLRPVHIGAALCDDNLIGPEPDHLSANNISRCEAYADLRLYHHIYKNYKGKCEHLAILQHRRMYYLGLPAFSDFKSQLIRGKSNISRSTKITVTGAFKQRYLSHLLRQTDECLRSEFYGSDVVANKVSFKKQSVQEQYLSALKATYPSRPEYLDAWYDMRSILEREISPSLVSKCLDGNVCYVHNCLITDWDNFEKYYHFLFYVIDELSDYSEVFRLFGWLSERILGVHLAALNLNVRPKTIMFFD
tara:strand:+ start:1294 stop:2094 length:801 start_codon:yes stop_codon:yes gene_type:complete